MPLLATCAREWLTPQARYPSKCVLIQYGGLVAWGVYLRLLVWDNIAWRPRTLPFILDFLLIVQSYGYFRIRHGGLVAWGVYLRLLVWDNIAWRLRTFPLSPNFFSFSTGYGKYTATLMHSYFFLLRHGCRIFSSQHIFAIGYASFNW